MIDPSRETRASAAFVALTDTLVHDFDIVEVMHTLLTACIDLLDTDAGGLLFADAEGKLQLMAFSNNDVEQIELVQLSAEAGPCWECFTTGEAVTIGDFETEGSQWSEFRAATLKQGYRSVHATPMHLRGRTIGSMNLFHSRAGALNEQDIALAQSLTDVATIAILQERDTRRLRDLSTQLQGALDSRVVIEQAKGVLAQSLNLTLDQAFAILRKQARSTGQSLQSVCTEVVDRHIVLTASGERSALGSGRNRHTPASRR